MATAQARAEVCYRDTSCAGRAFCVEGECRELPSPVTCDHNDDCREHSQACSEGVCKETWVVFRNDNGQCIYDSQPDQEINIVSCWDFPGWVGVEPNGRMTPDEQAYEFCQRSVEGVCTRDFPDELPEACEGEALELCKRYIEPATMLAETCYDYPEAEDLLRGCCHAVDDDNGRIEIECTVNLDFKGLYECEAVEAQLAQCIEDAGGESDGGEGEGESEEDELGDDTNQDSSGTDTSEGEDLGNTGEPDDAAEETGTNQDPDSDDATTDTSKPGCHSNGADSRSFALRALWSLTALGGL